MNDDDFVNEYLKYIGENNNFSIKHILYIKNIIDNVSSLINNITSMCQDVGVVFNYFFFCNEDSAYYTLFKKYVEMDNDIYEMGSIITYDEFTSDLVNIIYDSQNDQRLNILGWRKKYIFDTLLKSGIFKYSVNKYGNMYVYDMHKLKELGFSSMKPSKNPPNNKR